MSTQDPRSYRSFYGPVLGLLALLAGCQAAAPERPAQSRQVTEAITRLQARADVDSLAAAALMRVYGDRPAALALAVQALEGDPNRPDLLWLAISLCRDTPGCSALVWDRRLRSVDPRNAAAPLDVLVLATATGDQRAEQAAVAEIARSERLNLYWTRLLARAGRAATQTGQLSPRVAQGVIISSLSLLIPPLQPLTRRCTDEALAEPVTRDLCQTLASVLQNGDTVIAEKAGIQIALRAWPQDSDEWRAADTAGRAIDYRTQALGKDPQWATHHADQFLALAEANARERDLLAQQLVAMGLPPDPPAR